MWRGQGYSAGVKAAVDATEPCDRKFGYWGAIEAQFAAPDGFWVENARRPLSKEVVATDLSRTTKFGLQGGMGLVSFHKAHP